MSTKHKPAKAADLGQAEMQAKTDAAEDVGYLGTKVDPVPNEAYTLSGYAEGLSRDPADHLAPDAGPGSEA